MLQNKLVDRVAPVNDKNFVSSQWKTVSAANREIGIVLDRVIPRNFLGG